MSKIDRVTLNSLVFTSFLLIDLNSSSNRSNIEKDNVCYMYQKYVVDVAVSPLDDRLSEYDKYCEGLIVYKKLIDENIKENKELEKLFEEL